MGQYWEFINVDKREKFGWSGKLEEWFFDGSASSLLSYLENYQKPVPALYVEHGLPWISAGGWAGDRILCVGDYLDDGDYPDHVFTEEELAEFKDVSLYQIQDESFKDAVEPTELEMAYHRRGSSRRRQAPEVLCLCNLTTHEFVRSDVLEAEFADYEETNYPGLPDLSHALVARICWSSCPSGPKGQVPQKGCWAGHRFEIIHLPEEGLGEGWKDVSEEVVDELGAIWDHEWELCGGN